MHLDPFREITHVFGMLIIMPCKDLTFCFWRVIGSIECLTAHTFDSRAPFVELWICNFEEVDVTQDSRCTLQVNGLTPRRPTYGCQSTGPAVDRCPCGSAGMGAPKLVATGVEWICPA